jgi:lambda repressor-like predicted transcriptional regulator
MNAPAPESLENRASLSRIDVSSPPEDLLFPECPLRVAFIRLEESWQIDVSFRGGQGKPAMSWVERIGATSIVLEQGIAPRHLTARLHDLPASFARLFEGIDLDHLELHPAGVVSLFVRGKLGPDVRGGMEGRDRQRTVNVQREQSRITRRQLETISVAASVGYYDVPRATNLRALAKKLAISPGTLSEVLRRGEAHIVTEFLDLHGARLWDRVRTQTAQPEPAPESVEPTVEPRQTLLVPSK